MKIVLLSFVLALTQARPQEFASPDEVELIDPVRDDSGVVENGGGPIVVVVRGGVPNLPRLPGIGNFFNSVPGFSDFPFQSSVPRIPSIFGGLDGESDDIHTQMNGNHPNFFNHSFFDGNFDVNNSTYEEKELEDGTKVKINRTVLADTDGDGNQFFFHSSVVHNFGEDGLEVEQVPVIDEDPAEDVEDVIPALPDSDPAINEINDEVESEESPMDGVDEGLQQ